MISAKIFVAFIYAAAASLLSDLNAGYTALAKGVDYEGADVAHQTSIQSSPSRFVVL
jgi:hypothetical protein